MPENELSKKTGYSGPTRDDVRCLIREALWEHSQGMLRRLIEEVYKNVVLALFEEIHGNANGNVYRLVLNVMEQAAVKLFFAGEADKLLDKKMYNRAESQVSRQGLVHRLIKWSAFTVQIARFVERKAEKAVASKRKLRPDMSRKVPVKKEITPLSPLTGCSPETSNTSKDDKKKKKDKLSPQHHSKSSSYSTSGSSRHADDYKGGKNNKRPKGVNILTPMNTYFKAAMDFNNYRLQKKSQKYDSHI